MTRVLANYEGIAYNGCMQYTVRDIPPALDAELRRRARAQGKSLNAVTVEVLIRGAGLGETPVKRRDLSDLVGSWHEDPELDKAIAEQRQIDEGLWR